MSYLSYLIAIITLGVCHNVAYQEEPGIMRIDLIRQQSPRQQFIEHEHLFRQSGYNINFIYEDARTNDSIALYRYLDNEFYGKIVIGKPGKTMDVNFDTAWDRSWVMSSRCNVLKVPGCKNHVLYDHDRSSYYRKNGSTYNEPDGNYRFTGVYSYENISIAHSNVTDFLFIEMTVVPDSLQLNKADGVLGLGLMVDDYEPFFYTLYRQKKIRDPIFSVYLNRDRNSNRGGNVILGFIDYKHVHKTELPNGTVVPDTITYLPVDPGQYWKFSVDRMEFTKDPHNVYDLCEKGCKAIADTSSSRIIGPKAEIDIIHDVIQAHELNGRWAVNCDSIAQMPKYDIYLAGVRFRLGGNQYIIRESNITTTSCYSAFLPSTDNSFWIFGGAFLSQYYSIYNIADKTIGFVRAA